MKCLFFFFFLLKECFRGERRVAYQHEDQTSSSLQVKPEASQLLSVKRENRELRPDTLAQGFGWVSAKPTEDADDFGVTSSPHSSQAAQTPPSPLGEEISRDRTRDQTAGVEEILVDS